MSTRLAVSAKVFATVLLMLDARLDDSVSDNDDGICFTAAIVSDITRLKALFIYLITVLAKLSTRLAVSARTSGTFLFIVLARLDVIDSDVGAGMCFTALTTSLTTRLIVLRRYLITVFVKLSTRLAVSARTLGKVLDIVLARFD